MQDTTEVLRREDLRNPSQHVSLSTSDRVLGGYQQLLAVCPSTGTFPGILLFNALSVVHGHQCSGHGSDEPFHVIPV
jgi:hypothetical protein